MKDQSLEQRRAGSALQQVKQVLSDHGRGNTATLYASYAKALPPTILQIGLGQAMAMLLAQAKNQREDAHKILYDHVSEWLCGSDNDAPYRNQSDLIEAIVKFKQDRYVQAQAEALAYTDWLKKFAVAYLSSGE